MFFFSVQNSLKICVVRCSNLNFKFDVIWCRFSTIGDAIKMGFKYFLCLLIRFYGHCMEVSICARRPHLFFFSQCKTQHWHTYFAHFYLHLCFGFVTSVHMLCGMLLSHIHKFMVTIIFLIESCFHLIRKINGWCNLGTCNLNTVLIPSF